MAFTLTPEVTAAAQFALQGAALDTFGFETVDDLLHLLDPETFADVDPDSDAALDLAQSVSDVVNACALDHRLIADAARDAWERAGGRTAPGVNNLVWTARW